MTECRRCTRKSDNERMQLCMVCEDKVRETVRDYVYENHGGETRRGATKSGNAHMHVIDGDDVLCDSTAFKNGWNEHNLNAFPQGWTEWCLKCLDCLGILACDRGGRK